MRRWSQALVAPVLCAVAVALSGAPADAQVPADELEIILVIDTSGSMQPAIQAAKAAANEFVRSMPPEVRIGVETFGNVVTVLAPPTDDRALLAEEIDAIAAGGDTALYDALVSASGHFTAAVEHKVLVVLSDGKDDGSTATLEEAVAAVQGEHVEAISLTTAETDLDSLAALGTVTAADDPAGVSAAFARISSLFAQVVVEPTTVPATSAPAPTSVVPTSPVPPSVSVPATSAAPVRPAPTAPPPTAPAPAPTASSAQLLLGAVGVFAGLFTLGLLLFPRAGASKARLGIEKPRSVSDVGKRTMSAVDEALERYGKRADLATSLVVADIDMKPAEFVATVAVVATVAGLVGLLLGGPLVALAVAAVVCAAVRFHVRRKRAKRQAAFADQLPDVLQLLTTALRSGFGLTQALESVAEEADEPARGEFAHVLVEARMGRDLSDSLRSLAQRMESKDLGWVVSAIDINRETGGNLSEILHTVSATIRERGRMARHVRTLTAEGRMSARILTALPLLMLLWQWRANPDHLALMAHGAGLVALVVGGVLLVLGAVWVRKITTSIAL